MGHADTKPQPLLRAVLVFVVVTVADIGINVRPQAV